ncbi:TIGR04282 family arsenosugar biosynthesis glycosyltransferase [Lysobacter sp. A421]
MSGALAIFVKTPGRSGIKTRLAADCGEVYALDWYRLAAAAVASVARAAQLRFGVTAYWAVAEADALHAWPGLPTIAQGDGGLGARMAHVHAQLVERHGFGLLLGADTPQLTVGAIAGAAEWLSTPSPRLLLGAADDGGFWLFGANTVPPLPTWTAVRYSTSDTAHALQYSMRDCGDWRTLATLTDADHASDLVAVQRALEALPDPTPEQRDLAHWMREPPGSIVSPTS